MKIKNINNTMQNNANIYAEKYNKNTEKYKIEKKIYEKYTNKIKAMNSKKRFGNYKEKY